MIDLDERCLTCGYPRGSHKTMKIGWTYHIDGKQHKFECWEEGLCPDSHNMQQPSWDMYQFHGVKSGFPYESKAMKAMDKQRKMRKS